MKFQALLCAKAGSTGAIHALASILASVDSSQVSPTLVKTVTDLVVALSQGCDDNLKVSRRNIRCENSFPI